MDVDKSWLKPDQVDTMRDACFDDGFNPRLQDRNDAIIALMYDAGLRPVEVTNVTVPMFDSDAGQLRLPSSAQKQYPNENTPPPVTINLSDDDWTRDTVRTITSYLNSRDSDSLFMFPSRKGEAIKTRGLRYMVSKVALAADIQPYIGFGGQGEPGDVRPYTLRHSVAYRLLSVRDDGTTMYDVRNRLRHQSIQTTEKHYDHFDQV